MFSVVLCVLRAPQESFLTTLHHFQISKSLHPHRMHQPPLIAGEPENIGIASRWKRLGEDDPTPAASYAEPIQVPVITGEIASKTGRDPEMRYIRLTDGPVQFKMNGLGTVIHPPCAIIYIRERLGAAITVMNGNGHIIISAS